MTDTYKLIEFDRGSLFLPSKPTDFHHVGMKMEASLFTPLKNDDFLKTEVFNNFDARFSLVASDFTKTKLSKYFIDFPLYHEYMRIEVKASSNGKIVVACEEQDCPSRFYILDDQLNLMIRKELAFQFSYLLVNKSYIFLMISRNHQELLFYDFDLNHCAKIDRFNEWTLRFDPVYRNLLLHETTRIVC